MKCLVTGAAGFVGSSICDRLLRDEHEVIGVDCFVPYYPRETKLRNIRQAQKSSRFQLFEQDLTASGLAQLLDGVEWIFHQAAQAGVRASWGDYFESYTKNNVLATQRLLDAVRQNGKVKKIVFASSSSIYGNAEKFPTTEDILPKPVSPYGVTKLAAEHLMSLYASEFGVPSVSLRYFTVYGPRQRPDMAFNRFIRAGLTGAELTLYGSGDQSRDFTFVDDIVEANLYAAERGVAGSVLNIGGGTQATVNQLLALIESKIGKKLNIKREKRQDGDALHTGADTSKARQQIGFMPKVGLAEGIEAEIAWLRGELAI